MNDIFQMIDCPVCGEQSFKVVFETTPREFINEQRKSYYDLNAIGLDMDSKFYIRQCRNCSFVFVNPRLRSELYDIVYNKAKVGQYNMNDWIFEKGDLQHLHNMFYKWGPALDFLGAILYFRNRFSRSKNEGHRVIRLLDYGCGMGHLLDICKALEVDAVGTDIDMFRIEHCKRRGHRVFLPQELPGSEKFDIVVSHSVIEHVNDLNGYFQYVSERLLPGGIFRFNGLTPKIIQIERKKKDFRLVMLLEHLNYFTPKSLRMMAIKHGMHKVDFIKCKLT